VLGGKNNRKRAKSKHREKCDNADEEEKQRMKKSPISSQLFA
jgi:hypothetical protein